MVGRQQLSGKHEEIQFKVCISLCKNILPETDHLKRGAYFRVSQELSDLRVSPRYVGDVWKKHKEDSLDPLNKDLYVSVKQLKGSGCHKKISVLELHSCVKAVPFHFCKNLRTLSFKIGIPLTTIHRALKFGLQNLSKNRMKPILTPKNKLDCVTYCHSFVKEQSFVEMLDRVDIDEKWFYLSQKITSYILVPGMFHRFACVSTRITSRRQCVLPPWLAYVRIL